MPKKSSSSVKVFWPRFSREEVVARLRAKLPALAEALPLIKVVLFGSYARGNFTVASDIDLLVIYQGEENPAAFALCKNMLDLPGLEPHLFSEKECLNQHATLERMMRGGIVLFPKESPP
jgi:predicted nucleotidyltransferase